MSAFKGTPGPWAFMNGCDIFSQLGSDSGDGCKAAHNDGWHVATVPDTPTSVDGCGYVQLGWDVRKANALLIAAAPDSFDANVQMVAALNVAFHIEPGWDDDRIYDELPTSGVASAYFAARAAIRKATGEPA